MRYKYLVDKLYLRNVMLYHSHVLITVPTMTLEVLP